MSDEPKETEEELPPFATDPETGGLVCPECGRSTSQQHENPFTAQGLAMHRSRIHGYVSQNSAAISKRERMRRRGRGKTPSPIDAFAADEKACAILYTMYPDGIPTHDQERLLQILHFTDGLRREIRGL